MKTILKTENTLINKYKAKGYFTDYERKEAIKKIQSLRTTDVNVDFVTTIELSKHSTPFDVAPDGAIAAELQMQVNILVAELGTMN